MKTPVDLRVRLGALELANPVMTASGTFGYGAEFAGLVNRVVELGKEYHVAVPLYQQVADWGAKNL